MTDSEKRISRESPQEVLLNEVVAALKEGLRDDLVAVVLFGSRARGEEKEGSDWDLLLIARHLPEKTLQRHFWLKGMLPANWRGKMSILGKTPKELEAHLPSLLLDIAIDGIILHDTDGYVTRRLARLRRLLEKEGLYRVQRGRDLVWRWKHFPGFDWSLEWEAAP